MTPNEFRKLALSFADAIEAQHMAHPDFRVRGGKIFATLGYPDDRFGVLVLPPDAQQEAIARHPEVFEPVTGGWGRRGGTRVTLTQATQKQLWPWMEIAWRNAAVKKVVRAKPRKSAKSAVTQRAPRLS